MTLHTNESDDRLYVPGAWVLDEVIAANGDDPCCDGAVRRILTGRTVLLALAAPPWNGPPALLHCEVPVGGTTIGMLPVFTNLEYVGVALSMNPAWQPGHVVRVESTVVLHDLEPGEWLGINPWSDREFKLPPEAAAA